jgi:tetratricopeptide (TPR) repeat protein
MDTTRRTLLHAAAAAPLVGVPLPAPAAPETPTAYERALTLYKRYTPVSNADARLACLDALAQTPQLVPAHTLLAAIHRQDWNMGWTADQLASEQLAEEEAETAVVLARAEGGQPHLPAALEQQGWLRLYQGQHEEAIACAQDMLIAHPDAAAAYGLWAHALTYLGEPILALMQVDIAAGLQPLPRFPHAYHRGCAWLVWAIQTEAAGGKRTLEFYQQAERALGLAVHDLPRHRPAVSLWATTLMALGKEAEAGQAMAQRLACGALPITDAAFEPFIRRALPYRQPQILTRLLALWRQADAIRVAAL